MRDFIVEGGIRYVQFDATRAAGFTEALRVAALAEQHGAMVAPHTAPEMHGHLVLALPRCAFGVESHGGPDTDPLAHGLFREHPELRDGFLHIGDAPGFGLEPGLEVCRTLSSIGPSTLARWRVPVIGARPRKTASGCRPAPRTACISTGDH